MIAAAAGEFDIASKLLDAGTVNAVALAQARRESEVMGLPLVEVLLTHDWISDAGVAQAYAELSGLRFLDLLRRRPMVEWVLTLPENIARRKECLVYGEVSGVLVVAVADPVDPTVRTAVEPRYERSVQFVVSPRYQIREAIDEIYGRARARGVVSEPSPKSGFSSPKVAPPTIASAGVIRLASEANARPAPAVARTPPTNEINIVQELGSIVDEAVDRRASDVHLEPEDDCFRVRYRIDGSMIEARAYPVETANPMISRVKVLANLDITERRKPQDGRFTQRSFDQEIDIRVAVIPTSRGEHVTLRLLSQDRSRLDLEALGMGLELRPEFEKLIHRPHGIILLTGPTGSGKTTTLYVALQSINTVDRHIITIEDPVEYHIRGVNQVAVDAEYGVSFSQALRSILRHNPDVIMVGEIRDAETAHLALEASLTGHLVFATLHTNSAVGAVTRLLDMGCEPYLVASGLIGVMAQRLVRKICTNCKQAYEPTEAERKIMGVPPGQFGVRIYRGAGCSRCSRSGYFDRIGVFEYVPFDVGLADLVTAKATTDVMQSYAKERGAIILRDDAMTKVREGLTTLEEALRVIVYSE
ncbi:MAG: ATPase, T2SS/T4P/T4SS family [Phycisphaerales bacterium]|nr:ATPase, T2SS/T4P/T4SS family [Phycisphaerales bacterium]